MSSCARTDSVYPSTLCVTMTTTAATAQTSPRSAVSGAVTCDLKHSPSSWVCGGFFGGFFWSSMYRLSLQSIRRVDRTSSAVRTDAVSLKIHGSVMETSTVMTTQMKLQKIPGALAQVRHTESLQEYFIYSVHVFSIFIELVWLQDM